MVSAVILFFLYVLESSIYSAHHGLHRAGLLGQQVYDADPE